ncbi:DUF4930 family protein [Macrococcoides bohemicum]|uniref:DUF4930 family protein n=1 Tax=Macrococcoides bohemicum TaxID=1903056 RepID=A0AAE7Q373_9STAP|nr:DUF4930 family protein [Macrococcus bohemicus]MBC9873819.1 DUF4930 family protein [Macrococcus bohemicus]QRN50195.1 DUF4930 family protein [Macrococcus bohemicus]QYA41620.1 DUF4930 family protein [Macrococcus bohemicus]QYA44045.1 DUF4930 family protein [Macrococcus bohemicus]
MFKLIRRLIKISLLVVISVMIYFIFVTNPFNGEANQAVNEPVQNASTYTLEDNVLFRNIPLSQVKNAFNFMDKQEFMDVSGLTRMGYNDEYLIGQRGSDFIMYRFGENKVSVFQSENDLYHALSERQQSIDMKDKSFY